MASLAARLFARGLLERGPAVDGGLSFEQRPGRNQNFCIRQRDCELLFVKRPRPGDTAGSSFLIREGSFYANCTRSTHAAAESFKAHLPELRDFDTAANILVLEWVPGAKSLSALLAPGPAEDLFAILPVVARALASLHEPALAVEFARTSSTIPLAPSAPWVVSLEQHASVVSAAGPTAGMVLRAVFACPAIVNGLSRLRREARPRALIHGDVKLDNILILETLSGSEPRVRLIDWELCGLGEPLWDVGGMVQSLLLPTLGPLAGSPAVRPGRSVLHSAIRVFLVRYFEHAGIPPGNRPAVLELVARYAAARLVQTAYEYAASGADSQPLLPALLDASQRLFTVPALLASDFDEWGAT